MKIRRALPVAALLLALAACGSPADPAPASTPAVPSTPDAVAAAFAASFAAGDTPTACALTGGQALQRMTETGWCQRSPGWSTGYWSGAHCQLGEAGQFTGMWDYTYLTNTMIDRSMNFEVGVTGSGTDWKVTLLGAQQDPAGSGSCGPGGANK